MTEARAWAIFDDSLKTGPFRFTRRPCGPGDVKIDIKFCGICSSDMHIARNGWKDVLATRYPVVPGHEIVGHVTEVGAAVKKFKIGDSVGVGCLVDSCRTCDGCTSGLEQMCLQQTLTYNGVEKDGVTPTRGGYSDHIVVREEFVVRIPENLSLAAAAPLLCAGITMFSPLRHWKVVAGDHVGVVGLGGLGSMGVKLAKAIGAKVTVFTTSASKVALAKEIGADDVVISSDATAMGAVKDLKVIIDTASHAHDLNPYIGTLARDGTLVIVGAPETPNPPIQVFGLIMGRRSVAGSPIGGIGETQEMLDFCGKHNIVSDIELIPIQRINDAYDRLLKNDCKGRFVIDNSSLQNE